MNDEPSKGPGTNTGHGHIWKRPDRMVARCGGPALCSRCKADQAAYPEPQLLDSKPPFFVDHGDRIEVTWPHGRGLSWITPEAVEGWAAQVNELRRERDRLRESLGCILDLIGPDSFCGCEDCDKEQPAREQALLDAARLIDAESLPDLQHLQRVRAERPGDAAGGSEVI